MFVIRNEKSYLSNKWRHREHEIVLEPNIMINNINISPHDGFCAVSMSGDGKGVSE